MSYNAPTPSIQRVTCPGCGTEQPANAYFCAHCGASLAAKTQVAPLHAPREPASVGQGSLNPSGQNAICPSCGADQPPGRYFCSQCGTSLSAGAKASGAPLAAPYFSPAVQPSSGGAPAVTAPVSAIAASQVALTRKERITRALLGAGLVVLMNLALGFAIRFRMVMGLGMNVWLQALLTVLAAGLNWMVPAAVFTFPDMGRKALARAGLAGLVWFSIPLFAWVVAGSTGAFLVLGAAAAGAAAWLSLKIFEPGGVRKARFWLLACSLVALLLHRAAMLESWYGNLFAYFAGMPFRMKLMNLMNVNSMILANALEDFQAILHRPALMAALLLSLASAVLLALAICWRPIREVSGDA